MEFNQKKIDELTSLINDTNKLLNKLKEENDLLKSQGNNKYYLINLSQYHSHQEMTLYMEAIYSNGLKQIEKKWDYGQSIPTIIYDNE
jgi:hypothetical protein